MDLEDAYFYVLIHPENKSTALCLPRENVPVQSTALCLPRENVPVQGTCTSHHRNSVVYMSGAQNKQHTHTAPHHSVLLQKL